MKAESRRPSLLAATRSDLPAAVRAKAELGAGRLAWCQSRTAAALRHYRDAQGLYRQLGSTEAVGLVEGYLGFAQRDEANPEAARAHFYRAAHLGEAPNHPRVLATALTGLSSLAADEGDTAGAREAKEKSLAVYRSIGDQWIVALITGSLGRVCFLAGDHAAARTYLREFLILARDLGNRWTLPYVIEMLADIWAKESEAGKAVQLYAAASEQREALGLDFSPTEAVAHQSALSRLRAALSTEEFDETWEHGRSMGMQAAIELAV